MKKIVVVLGIAVLLAGCSSESSYNEQVDRYETLVKEEAGKVSKNLKEDKAAELHDKILELDSDVKDLEDKITKDKQITDAELQDYTKIVDKMEELINDYK